MSKTVSEHLKTSKRLLSYGCSIVFGDELEDAHYGHPSEYSFSALMAKDYNLPYQCHAIQGGSNERTTRKIAEYLREFRQEDDFLMIGWTSIYRKEIHIPEIDAVMNFVPHFNPSRNFEDRYQRKIIKEAYERYLDYVTGVSQLVLLEDLLNRIELCYNALENAGVDFLMFQSLIDSDESLAALQDYTFNKDKFYNQDTLFNHVSKKDSTWIMPRKHPSLEGHKYLKELFLNYTIPDNI